MLENKINELLESVSFGLQESLLTDSISLGEYNRQTVDYYDVYNEICKNEFDFKNCVRVKYRNNSKTRKCHKIS